jgi:hypothetical protein
VYTASLKQEVSFLAPPWEALVMACASTTALNAVAASADDIEVKIHGTICLPPLLAETEMNSASKTPSDLAMAFVTAMVSHDGPMGASDTGDKAMHHLHYAVQFCWAANKKLVPTLHYSIGTQTPKIAAWAKSMHQSWIMPASVAIPSGLGPSDATMQDMPSSLVTLTKTMPASYMLAAVRDEKKSNSFKKLGAHHQRMRLNASNVDMHIPVTSPIPSLVSFLDQMTSGLARCHLKYEIQTQCGLHFEPSQAFATMLHVGHLLGYRHDCPSNFSVYFCGRAAALAATSQESLLLHLPSTEGGGLSEAHILKALKHPHSLPVGVMRTTEQIQNAH